MKTLTWKYLKMSPLKLLNAFVSIFGIRTEKQPEYKVLQKSGDKELHQYQAFIMPFDKSRATLPQTNGQPISFDNAPAKKLAVIRYAGNVDQKMFKAKEAELYHRVKKIIGKRTALFFMHNTTHLSQSPF